VGRALAADLGWMFVDGDDHHSAEHVEHMRAGRGLEDAQRAAWLHGLHEIVERTLGRRDHLVLACSALKDAHRQALRGNLLGVRFVYLKAPRSVLESRLQERPHHFAGTALLESQLHGFEEPGEPALTVDATKEPAILVPLIRRELGL
jgi:gluconokinase